MKDLFVKKVSERIESVNVNGKIYCLLDEFDECDGGIIVGIKDVDMIKEDYGDDLMFEDYNGNEVGMDRLLCYLDIREGGEGYNCIFDVDGNMLIEC